MSPTPAMTLGYIICLTLVLSAIAAGDKSPALNDSFTVQPTAGTNFPRMTAIHVSGIVNKHLVNVSFAPGEGMVFTNLVGINFNKAAFNSDKGGFLPTGMDDRMVPIRGDGMFVNLNLLLIRLKGISSVCVSVCYTTTGKGESYFIMFAGKTPAGKPVILSGNITTVKLTGEPTSGRRLEMYLGVVIPVLVAFICGGVGGYVRMSKKKKHRELSKTLNNLPDMPREFGYRELKKATDNFDERRKLGEGGFGMVYKGTLPHHSVEVAVKKFSRDQIQSQRDFLAELTIINRLRHRNLLKLLGWCHKKGILLLVYEYMPNGSLDKHIFRPAETVPLCWELRFKVLTGVAHALHYLHDEFDDTVIHRDLKSSNIMLDANFNARLGDFGLARAIEHDKTSYVEKEGVVHGTMGYIAPECFHTGKATRESDIYAFGAVLLEVACGLRPWAEKGGYRCLVDWVWSVHQDGRIVEAVDERLGEEFVAEEVERVLVVGLACSHPLASERPKARTVLQILSGSMPPPHVPPFKPTFVWPVLGSTEDDTTTGPSNQVFQVEHALG